MALEPGQVVDNYRLDQIIHRGRATTVYAATDLSLRRKVAFKVLVEDYARDPAVRQRFVSEAQTAASLDAHPNIVTVYSWGQVGGSMYFVTAFIAGISLAELIERQPGGSGLHGPQAPVTLPVRADSSGVDACEARHRLDPVAWPARCLQRRLDCDGGNRERIFGA